MANISFADSIIYLGEENCVTQFTLKVIPLLLCYKFFSSNYFGDIILTKAKSNIEIPFSEEMVTEKKVRSRSRTSCTTSALI